MSDPTDEATDTPVAAATKATNAPQSPDSAAVVGTFEAALTAPNSKVMRSRALQLTQTTRMTYRRRVEDLANEVRMKTLEAQGQLDLRGDSAFALNPASKDFNATEWVDANTRSRMEIRNILTKLAVTYYGYTELFGEDPSLVEGIDISQVDNAKVRIPLLD